MSEGRLLGGDEVGVDDEAVDDELLDDAHEMADAEGDTE